MKCSPENYNLLTAWKAVLPSMVLGMNRPQAEYLHPALQEWPCTFVEGILTSLHRLAEDTPFRLTMNSLQGRAPLRLKVSLFTFEFHKVA